MKHILIFLFAIFLLGSCAPGKREPLNNLREANGEIFYGGTFIYNEVENFKSLYPLNVTEVVGSRIVTQIYEGLLVLSQKDLTVSPSLAESWEIDSTATIYTFKIRKGVKFHNDPCFDNGKGREVTAHDFKYCFEKLCEASPNNQSFWLFKNKVVGADDYYKSTIQGMPLKEGVAGIKVIDDYTLVIELIQPFVSFQYVLAMANAGVFPKEAVEKYGNDMRIKCIGTGPFRLKEVKEDEAVILVKNKNYWHQDKYGNQLPYLDAIKTIFIKEEKVALLEFKKGNIDMIYKLPIEMLEEVFDKNEDLKEEYKKYSLQKSPALAINYYGFQHQSDLFNNKKVRQAFNYAIDRKKLVDFTLKGMAIQGIYGFVPPALVGYDAKAIKGFEYAPDKAAQLLAQAGFPNGENFPEISLQINAGGGRNIQIAEVIQKMLEESLNIKIKISVLPWPQHLESISDGKALFWRTGWIADYPDPENFLNLLYSIHIPENPGEKSYLNSFRYKSSKFDSLFNLALQATDEDMRNMFYIQADQTIIDDAAIIPLFYDKNYRLLQPYLHNFPQNPMEYRNLKDVYFMAMGKNKKLSLAK